MIALRNTPQAGRAGRRGAATAEAVIVLPFFLLVLALVLSVRNQYIAAQHALTRARTCAWLYSANGCDRVPEGCAGLVRSTVRPSNDDAIVRDGLHEALERGDGVQDLVAGAIKRIVYSAIDDAFRRSAESTVARAVEKPPLLGRANRTVTARQHLACNLRSRTPGEVLEEAARVLLP